MMRYPEGASSQAEKQNEVARGKMESTGNDCLTEFEFFMMERVPEVS